MNPSGGSNPDPARPASTNTPPQQGVFGGSLDPLNTGPIGSAASLDTDLDSTQAVIDAEERQARQQLYARRAVEARGRYVKFSVMAGVLLIGLVLVLLRHDAGNKNLAATNTDASQRFPVTSIPLANIATDSPALAVTNAQTLSINGQLTVNNSLVIAPTTQPNGAVTGQLYYDQTTNQLSYFNGSSFQTLLSGTLPAQTTINGVGGAVTTGTGLGFAGNTLSNTGVLTLQGESGNVTLAAGPGIVVNGTTLSNSGILSLGGQNGDILLGTGLSLNGHTLNATSNVNSIAGSGNISVSNDGNGNYTIGTTGQPGMGTVTSPGGTTGKLAVFDGVQDIADSLVSQSGGTVTVTGSLSVTGGLTLGTALSVGNGGTGATAAPQARTNLGAAASGANNDITQLTGLTTALSVSQGGTGVGILPANGVLLGNGTSAISGVTAGSAGLCLISTAGAPSFQACPGSGGVSSVNSLTGALTLQGVSGSSVSSAGSTITIADATSAVKGLASFNSTNFTVTSGAVNTVQDIATTSAPQFGQLTIQSSQAAADMLVINNTNAGASGNLLNLKLNGSSKLSVSAAGNLSAGTYNGQTISSSANFTGSVTIGTTLTVNTISPTSGLTVGVGNQSFTLQGNASSSVTATNGTNTTTLNFQNPTANVTYSFPTATAGSYNICTTAGNCVGVGGGVTTPGGTTNKLAKFTASGVIGDSILTDNGSTVTVGGTLSVNTISPTGALTVGATGQNLTLQGAGVSLTATAGGVTNTLSFAAPSSGNKTITIPNASGTVAVSASGPLSLDSAGNLTCPTCLTGGGGGGSGVSSVNTLTGALTLQGSDASSFTNVGTTITVADASSTVKGLAKFDGTNLVVTSGAVNTAQNITTSAAPTFAGLTLSSALTVANGGTGGTTQATARSGIGAAASGANSDITSLSGLTTALSVLQGGTGATSLTANGVLIGNGTSPVSSVTGSNGQCLVIVTGSPTFTTCPGSGGVTSVDGLSGVLTINNSSGSGSAITIDNAAADGSTKGIATFNSTNFSDNGSGVINTKQDIATGSSPTFAGLTLSSPLTVGNGGTGLATLTANELLFANTGSSISQLSNGSSGLCLVSNGVGSAPSFQTCTGAGGVSSVTASGTGTPLTGAITINNATSSSNTITIQDAKADGTTKGIAAFNATNFSASSGVINTAQDISTGSSPTFANLTVNTTLNTNSINPSSALTVGATSQSFTLQGNASSSVVASNGTNTTTLNFQNPTANVTYSLLTAAAGSYNICTTAGNCVGLGGGITGSGTSGKIALFNGTNTLTSSDITDTAGTSLSVGSGVSLTVQGAATFENSSNSSAAFRVQSATAAATLLNVDTSANIITVGDATAGGELINNGSTLNTAKALGNITGASIGTAAATVDAYTTFTITQTTASITASIPSPTNTAAGRIIYISNLPASTQTITVGGATLAPGTNANFLWNGSAWAATAVTTGVSAVGAFSGSSQPNGASISGNTITFGPADATNPGMVSTGTQTFAGAKTIQASSTSAFQVQNTSNLPIFAVDTSNNQTILGNITSTAGQAIGGKLVFADNTNSGNSATIQLAGNLAGSGTIFQLYNGSATTQTICTSVAASCSSTYQAAGSYATTTLNNLGTTAINAALNFQSTSSASIGFSGAAAATGNGLTLTGQTAGSTANNGGAVTIQGGTGTTTGTGGLLTLQGGASASNGTDGGVTIDAGSGATTPNGTIGIGGANASTINIGSVGSTTKGTAVHIGDTSSTSGTQAVTIGDGAANANSTTTIQGGSGASAVSIQAAASGTISIASSNNNSLNLGTGAVAGLITIGGTGTTGTMTIGQSTDSNTINIGNANTATGKTQTINIGNGNDAGTGKAVVTIGNTKNASQTTIQGGTAGVWINTGAQTSTTGSIFIQSGDSTSGTSGNISIDNGNGVVNNGTNIVNDTFDAAPCSSATNNYVNWFGVDSANGGSLTPSGAVGGQSGSCSLAVTEATDDGGFWGIEGPPAGQFSVTPGKLYKFSAWVRAGSVVQNIGGDVVWVGGSGQIPLTTVTDTTTGWTQISGQGVAPSGASQAYFTFTNTSGGGTGTSVTYFDTITVTADAGEPTVSIGSGNAQSVTIGNLNQTWSTTVQGGSGGVNVNSTTGKITLTSNGASSGVLVQSATNSTVAFQVQNAAGTAFFITDTTNERVYIGPTAGDTTGALLVLGNKTNSGDPTGVAGAMYYNGSTKSFRCYDVDHWMNCLQTARDTFHQNFDYISAFSSSDICEDDNGGVGGISINGVTGHPSIEEESTYAGATNHFSYGNCDINAQYQMGTGDYWRFESDLRIPTLSNGTQRFSTTAGFSDTVPSLTPGNSCEFQYSDTINGGKWEGYCSKAGVSSTCDTGTTVAAATWYRLDVSVNSAGTTATFQVNGSTTNGSGQCQISTNLPTTAPVGWDISIIKSIGTTARLQDLDYVDLYADLGTSR